MTTPTGISNYVFSVEDSPTSVTIFPDHGSNTPLVLGLADHHYPVNGFAPMHAAVHSYLTSRSGPELTIANCSTGTLNVCLRDQRTVRVDFHIMRDSAAVTHTTTVTEAQIDGIVTALNNVWTPQANIVFIKGSVATNTLAGDRGLNIETNVGTSGMVDEWPLITAFNSGIPQSFNVYFVWGGWTSYDDATHTWSQPDVGLAIRNGNHFDTLISDTAMAQIPALAHELGHLLGLWWLPNHLGDYDLTASNGDELMVADTFGTGTLVRHYQVDFIPDH